MGRVGVSNALIAGMRQEMRSSAGLALVAGRQFGVVSARQLRRLGYSASAVSRAVRAGRLHRVHRGVYAVGHANLTRHGLAFAAVLACGRGAALSHGSAAWLWGLRAAWSRTAEVSVPARGRGRAGIVVHHAPGVPAAERTVHERIPVTSVARTLFDLAAAAVPGLGSAIERAERLGLFDAAEIDRLLARHPHAPGTTRIRAATDIYRAPAYSRARSERLFLAFVAAAGLPRPALNTWVAGFEVDAYWQRERFAVEVDGWETHRTRRAFEDDRVRQEDLKLAGVDSVLVTARRIEREPAEVGRRLATHLARRRRELGR